MAGSALGQGRVANPTAMMFSPVMMLLHLKETAAANRLKAAIEKVYAAKTNGDARSGRQRRNRRLHPRRGRRA
jgi:isocitrate/isopropylmalate dehydrogenase